MRFSTLNKLSQLTVKIWELQQRLSVSSISHLGSLSTSIIMIFGAWWPLLFNSTSKPTPSFKNKKESNHVKSSWLITTEFLTITWEMTRHVRLSVRVGHNTSQPKHDTYASCKPQFERTEAKANDVILPMYPWIETPTWRAFSFPLLPERHLFLPGLY